MKKHDCKQFSIATGFKANLTTSWEPFQTSATTATSRKNSLKQVYSSYNRMPFMQWQGKSTNFSTNQVWWIDQSNIKSNSGNCISELQQFHIRLTAYYIIEDNLKKFRTEIKKVNWRKIKNVIVRLTTEMNHKEKHLEDISTLTGVSKWLKVLPITNFGFVLSKQPFWDLIRLGYGWENMQSTNILSLR